MSGGLISRREPLTRRVGRLWPRLALLVVAAVALISPRPGVVLAHAVLVRSDPAQNAKLAKPPQRVDLFFSEPLNHSFSTIRVLDSSGKRHDTPPVQFTADSTGMTVGVEQLDPSFYAVHWTTLSAVDGHRWEGVFPFTVLNSDGSLPPGAPASLTASGTNGVSPLDVGLRWLLLLGLIGVTGAFGFATLVLYPATRGLPAAARSAGRGASLRLLGLVVTPAAVVVALASLAALLREAALAGSLNAVPDLLTGVAGTSWLARELIAAGTAGLAWWLARPGRRQDGPLVPALLLCGLLLSLAMLLTMSLTSHAAAGVGAAWAIPSDFLHLAGVAWWLGGVAQLPALLPLLRPLPSAARLRLYATAMRRFSTLAVMSLVVVLGSGGFNALVQIPNWGALVATGYGRALLVKLGVVVPLLGVALLNGTWLARRVERQAAGAELGLEQRAQRLARSAVLESIIGAVVVGVTATLVFLIPATSLAAQNQAQPSPPSVAPASIYQRKITVQDLRITLSVTPNAAGENHFLVQLTGPGVDRVLRVQLRFQTKGQAGFSSVDVPPIAGTQDAFTVDAANLTASGSWQVTVNVRRTGYDDVDGRVRVEVPTQGPSRSPTQFPAHGIRVWQAWTMLALTLAGLLLVAGWRLGRLGRPSYRPWTATGAVILGVTAVLVLLLPALPARVAGIQRGSTTAVAPVKSAGYTSWSLPTPASGLMMPAVGPDGRVWVGEMTANKLAVLNPAANTVTEFNYPGSRPAGTMGIVVDRDNHVWLAQDEAHAIGTFDPKTGAYRELRTPTANSGPSGLALDAQGRVWFTELSAQKIGVYDPVAGTFAEFSIPGGRFFPYWLAVASDGRVWFTNAAAGELGVLDPQTRQVQTVAVPGADATTGVAVAPDGTVWFGVRNGKLGRLDPGAAQPVLLTLAGSIYGVVIDRNGTVWAATTGTDVYAYDPRTEAVRSLSVGGGPWWITTAADGAIWVAEGTDEGNALGQIAPAAAQQAALP